MVSSIDVLAEAASAVVNQRGIKVLKIVTEGTTTRRVLFELCRGPEISLQSELGFHLQKDRGVLVTWTLPLRWPRAEEMLRDLRPPSPYGADVLTAEVLEARAMLYPIAQLRIDEDPAYFARPSPVKLAPTELETISALVGDVVEILVKRVAPEFCSYCDIDELSRMAVEPEAKSRLLMAPMDIPTILAAAGKRQEFEAWREAYRKKFIVRDDVKERHEKYMSALKSRLPN
jgi:hypothetical protein